MVLAMFLPAVAMEMALDGCGKALSGLDNKWEITDKQHFLFKEDDKLSKIDNFLFFLILDIFKRNWKRNVPSKCKINWNGTA